MKNAVIDNFTIYTGSNNNLILAIRLTIDNGLAPIQMEVCWNSSRSKDDVSQRILGLLKVAGVTSTKNLPEAEVRVAMSGNNITAIGHKSEQRWWQLQQAQLCLVA
ncbi:MAG: hypothetical protein K2Y32_11825 [Candidatus Obscuribacterales bacterium]|nr:hypothetical protein [Candidatus Obscuribacterales bacterium]